MTTIGDALDGGTAAALAALRDRLEDEPAVRKHVTRRVRDLAEIAALAEEPGRQRPPPVPAVIFRAPPSSPGRGVASR